MKYEIIVVGAGISGCVIAEQYANLGKKVLVIDKRNHIGGNCYDYNNSDGILVHKYGPHFFHTNDYDVWQYVSRFTSWIPYEHRVLSAVNDLHVPVPVNINTINILFCLNIKNENQMKQWLKKEITVFKKPKNSEESALNRFGKKLYELIFKNYTIKQWGIHPKNLDPLVMDRIPIRYNFDDRYFSDKYQGVPEKGYTNLFKNILSHKNITVKLKTDYFKVKKSLSFFNKLFYTGPIDQFFDFKHNKLPYRSLIFKFKTLNIPYFQSHAQINYPNSHQFTRIVEIKHATKQISNKTTIVYEYSSKTGDPFYPIPTEKNIKIYQKYYQDAQELKKHQIYFVGRLANYKYFNMDQAFKNALDFFEISNN